VRPGVWMHEVEMAAREVIEKAGYGDAFMHGIGHQLGIEVHDANPDGPLRAGMVVTIEPGVYIAAKRLGVRIEDDVLVTAGGAKNLTEAIPREAAEVEAMVGASR
jgi:Xaa-Pro aminopeptidase